MDCSSKVQNQNFNEGHLSENPSTAHPLLHKVNYGFIQSHTLSSRGVSTFGDTSQDQFLAHPEDFHPLCHEMWLMQQGFNKEVCTLGVCEGPGCRDQL